MAGMNTLKDALRNGIADNAATKTWCQTNYSRDHKVYVGIDLRKPPGEAAYPLVHLFPTAKTVGYAAMQSVHCFGVACGINDTTILTIPGKANVVEYEGVEHIEEFRKLVETAFVAAIPSGVRAERMEAAYETVDEFPFFFALMTFDLAHDYVQGDGVFD